MSWPGPNDLSIVDTDAIPAVLGAGGLVKGRCKSSQGSLLLFLESDGNFIVYDVRKDPTAPSNLVAMSGDAHANRRRLWNRGMSSDSLKDYEEIIVKRATQLVERLEGLAGPVDLMSWINYFTYICSRIFFMSAHGVLRFRFDFMGDMA